MAQRAEHTELLVCALFLTNAARTRRLRIQTPDLFMGDAA